VMLPVASSPWSTRLASLALRPFRPRSALSKRPVPPELAFDPIVPTTVFITHGNSQLSLLPKGKASSIVELAAITTMGLLRTQFKLPFAPGAS
jgi:hypothetical protein